MKPLVFAGPTLHGYEVGDTVDVAPPAACGDLLAAVDAGRRIIGLIDGTFEAGPAVWHKEILYALSSGCQVFGAASMGALRAAECEPFGMVGVGGIFAAYRAGRRVADADVALTFGPPELGYPPTSLALVDAEDGLERLHAAGLLTAIGRTRGEAAARRLFFKDRTWDRIFEPLGAGAGETDLLRRWLAGNGPGLKTRDALELIGVIAAARPAPQPVRRFEATLFFDLLRPQASGG